MTSLQLTYRPLEVVDEDERSEYRYYEAQAVVMNTVYWNVLFACI